MANIETFSTLLSNFADYNKTSFTRHRNLYKICSLSNNSVVRERMSYNYAYSIFNDDDTEETDNFFPEYTSRPHSVEEKLDVWPTLSNISLNKELGGVAMAKVWQNSFLSHQNIIEDYVKLDNYIDLPLINETLTLSTELKSIADEIESSRYILNLKKGWDEEGAYEITPNIWERAVIMLAGYSKWLFENKGLIISAPSIDPVPDGSIDLLWHTAKARMLINIKNTEKPEAHYYGDLYNDDESLKGTTDTSKVKVFFAYWLANLAEQG